jgi:aminoglycoside phosphotransferase
MPVRARLSRATHARLAKAGVIVVGERLLARSGDALAWRLEVADGGTVKLRRFPRALDARRVGAYLALAHGVGLPQPLWQEDRLLLTEFVVGTSLDVVLRQRGAHEARWVREAGRLLAALHAVPVNRRHARPLRGLRRSASLGPALLAERGLMSSEAAARFERLRPPRNPPVSLTHGDLCPENLIVEPGGRLRVIDEERLAVRHSAFDLARAVQRWRLDRRLERVLLAGYGEAGGDARSYEDGRGFWLASAWGTSAVYRVHTKRPGLRRIAAGLRRLLVDLPD